MDGRRFDGIARTWSRGLDRRGALRSLSALLVAGWSAERAAGSVSAQDGLDVPCSSNGECRGRNPDDCMLAHCWRGRCAYAAIRCAAGYACCGNGRCCENEPAPLPGCRTDADCASSDPCVSSRCETGLCVATVIDCAPGYACCGAAGCCLLPRGERAVE